MGPLSTTESTHLPTQLRTYLCVPSCLVFLIMKTLMDFNKARNAKGEVQDNPNVRSKSNQVNIPPLQSISSKRGAAQ